MLRAVLVAVLFVSVFVFAGNWFTDFEKALDSAKKSGKKLFIYFYSDHCPYCLQMEEFVLGDPEVDSFINDNFVVLSVDVDKNRSLNRRFGVIGTPFFVIYDPRKDRVITRIFGSREKEVFLSLLTGVCKKSNLRRC